VLPDHPPPHPQANNVYIFPALGHAAIATRGRQLTDEMFVVAAEELAGMTAIEDVEAGRWVLHCWAFGLGVVWEGWGKVGLGLG